MLEKIDELSEMITSTTWRIEGVKTRIKIACTELRSLQALLSDLMSRQKKEFNDIGKRIEGERLQNVRIEAEEGFRDAK